MIKNHEPTSSFDPINTVDMRNRIGDFLAFALTGSTVQGENQTIVDGTRSNTYAG